MRRKISFKLGNETLIGKEKCLTGTGESQVLTFGSTSRIRIAGSFGVQEKREVETYGDRARQAARVQDIHYF